jgi:hypothetical protein
MIVSNYLKRQLDIALTMLESEMAVLGIPDRGNKSILIPEIAYRTNSVALIQNIMGIVLFDKNRQLLVPYYDVDIGKDDPVETWADFDNCDVKAVKLKMDVYGPLINTPTLTTRYGDIILGVGNQVIADIYSTMVATVDLRSPGNEEEDSTNVVKVDFTHPTKKH